MELREFGNTELKVSPICFGGNVLGWTVNEAESFKILDLFIDNGYNFIDTANSYSTWAKGNTGGESETVIGKWFKKNNNRSKIVLATKVGAELFGKKGLKKLYIKEAVEASLKRLQTDYIDLYQSHFDDLETPVSETMEAFNDLIKEGKVRCIGASNLSAERIKESNDFSKKYKLVEYSSLQPHYNLYERDKFENEYLPLVIEEKLAVITYFSLASGFLSGKYKNESDFNKSIRGSSMNKYLNEKGKNILSALGKISLEKNIPYASISIAWLLNNKYITSAIVSATNNNQLAELFKATDLQLTNEEMELLYSAGKQ
ncbi:MAG: aldo/keto reductase [Ferruginibacter sp.]